MEKVHFVGVAGAGMSALAQLRALAGIQVTGSDRLTELGETRARLEKAGIKFFPQDGSGLSKDTSRVVASTAVESDNADLKKAGELGLKLVHRADELASIAAEGRTVAVGGTSGKSTVTAMIFHVLEAAGVGPSLAAGAMVPAVKRKGLLGNAWRGQSDLLVMEADESDGTLTKYSPELGVLLNITKDHKEVSELLELFRVFKKRSKRFVVNAALAEFTPGARTYALGETALTPYGSSFTHEGVAFKVNVPGRHNAENALAAAVACQELGVSLKKSSGALESYETVARRFESVGKARGVEVIDDFAHNPEKVAASWAAARLRGKRVLAVFQFHGFAPARFMKPEFTEAFGRLLGPGDALWLPDIYYVGGTAAKDIFASDYVKALPGKRVFHAPDRARMVEAIAAEAQEGDVVLVMGARDPSLSALAASILKAL